MKKPTLSRQQRREQRKRQAVGYTLPPGVTRQQFLAVAAREWAAVTGGDGVVLDGAGREVPPMNVGGAS